LKTACYNFFMFHVVSLFASGGQGALLKNRPLDPHKTIN
jgi:hypothetical protein